MVPGTASCVPSVLSLQGSLVKLIISYWVQSTLPVFKVTSPRFELELFSSGKPK